MTKSSCLAAQWAITKLVLLLLSVFSAAACVQAAHEPDDWNRFHFTGNQTFTDSQLRAALVAEPDFLLANHPKSNNEQVHEVTTRLLTSGYQHAGFASPQIEVQTSPEGTTAIQIIEGPRYHCGSVSVKGAKLVDATQLARYLTTPQVKQDAFPVFHETNGQRVVSWIDQKGGRVTPSKPDWKIDSPVPFGSEKHLKTLVQAALKTMGFASAECLVSIERNDELKQAQLTIDLSSEGPQDSIHRIIVDGCKQNQPDQVIQFLELQVGQVYDESLKHRIGEKLWNCGRFQKYSFRLDRDDSGVCTLRIALTETSGVPALSEPLNEVAEALLKARDWLSQCDARGDDMVFQIHRGSSEILVVQSASGMIANVRDTRSEPTAKNSSLLVDSNQVLLNLGQAHDYWSADISQYPGVIRFEIGVSAADTDDKFATVTLGFNFNSQRQPNSPLLVHALNLSPAGWCAFAYKPNCEIVQTEQTVRLSYEDQTIEIECGTGRLLRLESDEMQFRLQRGVFDSLRQQVTKDCVTKQNVYAPSEPLTSLVKFLSSTAAAHSYQDIADLDDEPMFKVNSARISAVHRLAASGLLEPIDLLLLNGRTEQSDSKFEVPDHTPQPTSFADGLAKYGAKYLLKWLPDLFAEGTWPMQISREACLVLVQRGHYTNDVLSDLARDPSASPLRDSCLAALLSLMNHPAAKPFAARAIETLEPASFDRDLQLLLSGPTGQWFRRVMKGVGELTDEEFVSLLEYVDSNESKEFLTALHGHAKSDGSAGAVWYQATHERLQRQLQSILQR